MTHETTAFCRICEAQCGRTVRVDGDRITAVQPDRDHVVSRGYVCVKGLTLENVRASPDRLLRPPLAGHDYLGLRVVTSDGEVHLAPYDLVALARQRLPTLVQEELQHAGRFKLITRRERFTHNSWAHNDPAFIKGTRSTNYLYVHPDDAHGIGIVDGEMVRVRSASGEVCVPGSVALPHGWGHRQADGLTVASTTTGVNANILAADGPDAIAPISGMAHFNGILVSVEPLP